MDKSIEPVRGMPDILPEDIEFWHFFERHWFLLMKQYGYSEIRMPILEKTSLFKRSIGEVTDIVEKEMFTFNDRDENSITMRPEGTASCVRACLSNGLLPKKTQNLWYYGPMFRYERPQKGRYRQFYQVGVESFGVSSSDIEVEHILMISRLWKSLNISEYIKLEINCLGDLESRNKYKNILVSYLKENIDSLDEDSKRRLTTNPLRVLDSKNPSMQDVIQKAPKLIDYIDDDSKNKFQELQSALDFLNIKYVVNPFIVRGLDYYNSLVYEWTTDKLGSQSAVCAGGRFDSLVEQLGCKYDVPAVGLALGVDRVVLLLKQMIKIEQKLDIYFISCDKQYTKEMFKVAEYLRNNFKEIKIKTHSGEQSLKAKLKKADQSSAKIAMLIGEEEINNNTVTIKYLREKKSQETISMDDLSSWVEKHVVEKI